MTNTLKQITQDKENAKHNIEVGGFILDLEERVIVGYVVIECQLTNNLHLALVDTSRGWKVIEMKNHTPNRKRKDFGLSGEGLYCSCKEQGIKVLETFANAYYNYYMV